LLLGIETDWGRGIDRLPAPAPTIEPKPIATALLPEYRVEGGLEAHTETVSRTLFNPTRRPAPVVVADAARVSMPKGKFVLMGTAVAGERHIAFLKEVAGGKSRVVKQGEEINGVLVASVGADRVKFTQGNDSEELVLKAAPGPKTTTQPPPPAPTAAAPPPGGVAPLPGSVAPVTPADGASPPALTRRPAGASALPAPVVVPGAAPSPAVPASASQGPATPASGGQGTAASPDPAERDLRADAQRNAPNTK
jgi:hypothetical protein